jgi:hypothetical protein
MYVSRNGARYKFGASGKTRGGSGAMSHAHKFIVCTLPYLGGIRLPAEYSICGLSHLAADMNCPEK